MCILRDHEKKKLGKSNTGIAIIEIILEFEEKKCFHLFIYLIAYRFIFVMCFNESDAHKICFTEYVLLIYNVNCIICDVTLFSVSPNTKHFYMNIYQKSWAVTEPSQ